jgi:D-aminoacyl-tRNA deacylase
MRVLVQRVSSAQVRIDGQVVGQVGRGLLALVGVTHGDTVDTAQWCAGRVAGLRIFADDQGKMNRAVTEVGGGILVVSQFTLYGDATQGRRPSFVAAAPPDQAVPVYEAFVTALRTAGLEVSTGRFGAMMDVESVNEGPVTIWLER